jgi:hypothetical protein
MSGGGANMARGWESKAVAEQIEEATDPSEEHVLSDSEFDSEKRLRDSEKRLSNQHHESLRLSRSRTLEQLDRATNPRHREMLRRSLVALEKELTELG